MKNKFKGTEMSEPVIQTVIWIIIATVLVLVLLGVMHFYAGRMIPVELS